MPQSDADTIRVTITLDQGVYEEIKLTSRQLGLKPATWITMVATAKINNLNVTVKDKGVA